MKILKTISQIKSPGKDVLERNGRLSQIIDLRLQLQKTDNLNRSSSLDSIVFSNFKSKSMVIGSYINKI